MVASVALLATSASAMSVGSAVVVNKCNYEVYLCNVPAADGGYSEIDKTLQPNDTYSQHWTQLSNGNGWSLKLSKDNSLGNIMQYEYTFHNDGTIWYDLSDVNGNPWDGNWEVTAANAANTCEPKQQAYRYATDDAYGMQACTQDSEITVTLCSGESQDDAGAASASSSVAAATSSAAISASSSSTSISSAPTQHTFVAVTTADSTTTSATSSSSSTRSSTRSSTSVYVPSTTVSPTTFATSTAQTTVAPNGVTVTQVATAVVTDVVTVTRHTHWNRNDAAKRHEHHRRQGHA